jgi:hypothetical protein
MPSLDGAFCGVGVAIDYLKVWQAPKADSQRDRGARHISQAKRSEPTPSESEEDIPRPPADIPDVKR